MPSAYLICSPADTIPAVPSVERQCVQCSTTVWVSAVMSALQDAVKMAREKANTRPVVDRTGTGRVVFTYLFQ